MTIRELTEEQFSPNTTVDGNRIEKALNDTQEKLNDIPLRNISGYTATKLHSSITPAIRQYYNDADGGWGIAGKTYKYNTAPFLECNGGNPGNYIEAGASQNNSHRFKGVLTDYSVNSTAMDAAGGGPTGSGKVGAWVWCNTYYFTKPAILHELSVTADYDLPMEYDVTNPSVNKLRTKSYYNNDWVTRNAITDERELDSFLSNFQVIVMIDNNIDLGNTHARTQIIHVWDSKASSFMRIPEFGDEPVPPDNYLLDSSASNAGERQVHLYEQGDVYYVVDAMSIRIGSIGIPIPQNSRVKMALLLPQTENAQSYNFPNTDTGSTTAWTMGCNTNIWTMEMTMLEELQK